MSNLDVALTLRLKNLLSKDARIAAKDLAGINAAAAKLGKNSSAGRLANDLKLSTIATGKLGNSWTGVARSADTASRAMQKATRVPEITALERRINNLSSAYDRLGRSAATASNRQARVGRGGRRRGDFGQELFSRVGGGGNAYLLGAGRGAVGGAALGAGVAGLAYAQVRASQQAISFEKAMANVQKKVDLDPGATMADVEEMINRNARAFGIQREQMAELAAQAGQAGIAYKDLEEFMRLAARASVAWDIAPKDAAQSLAEIKASTQGTMAELSDLTDMINTLGDKSAASEKDILEMFKRSGDAAKAAGVDFKSTLAVTTALRSIGMQEEVASRFFNAFSSKLRTASGQPDKAAEGYKMIGMTVNEVENGMKKDAMGTILKVLEKIDKHKDAAKVGIKLFGQEWWDEAARAGKAIPEMIKNFNILKDSVNWKGSAQKSVNIDLGTTQSRLDRMKNVVSQIGGEFGKWTLDPIKSAIDAMLDRFEKMKADQKKEKDGAAIGQRAAEGGDVTKADIDAIMDPDMRRAAEEAYAAAIRKGLDEKSKSPIGLNAAEIKEVTAEIARLIAEIEALNAQVDRNNAGKGDAAIKETLNRSLLEKIQAYQAELEALQARLATASGDPSKAPQWKRPNADLVPNTADIDTLISKLKELHELHRTLQIVPEAAKSEVLARIAFISQELHKAFKTDLSPAARHVMATYLQGINAEGARATAAAKTIADQIRSVLEGPFIIKIEPRLSGAPVPVPNPQVSPPKPAPQKRSENSGGIRIATVNVHGVRDLDSLRRQLTAAADRSVRDSRDGALGDTDTGTWA